jgi:hypothetical protein
MLQVAAAAELYVCQLLPSVLLSFSYSALLYLSLSKQKRHRRDWKYHKELKIWFTESNKPNTYVYFDVNTWEKRTESFAAPLSSVETTIAFPP